MVQVKEIIDENDFPLCIEVIRAGYATVAKEFNLTNDNFPIHNAFIELDKLFEDKQFGAFLFGLFDDEKIIGTISISRQNETVYEFGKLTVLPEYRHLGYGKMLVDFCKNKVKELGGKKIKISIIEDAKLKNWYIKNGFTHSGIKEHSQLPFTSGFMEYKI